MGGSGSGRKPKANGDLDPGEIIGDGQTVINGPDPIEDKPKKKKPPKVGVKADEARQKIFMLFEGLARFTGKDCSYSEGDFTAEGAGLARLADKFNMVGYVITLLDPLFIALSLAQKYFRLSRKKEAKEQANPAAGQQNNIVNIR